MENEAHVKNLHTSLLRSKWAIFAIVGFLTLLTYLLITVSKQVGTTETQINTAPLADEIAPDEPMCKVDYEKDAQIMGYIKELERSMCESGPTSQSCIKFIAIRDEYYNLRRKHTACCTEVSKCPRPTITPTPVFGNEPTGTPAPTSTPRPYPTNYPTGRYYPTATPAPRPQPTSSGPIIPIDPQPTNSPY